MLNTEELSPRDIILIKAYNSGFRYCAINIINKTVRLFKNMPKWNMNREYFFVPDKMDDDLGTILTGRNKLLYTMFPAKFIPGPEVIPTSHVVEIKELLFTEFIQYHKELKL